jgi:hypothetical protein
VSFKLKSGTLVKCKTTILGTGSKGKNFVEANFYGIFLSKEIYLKEKNHYNYKILFPEKIDEIYATENEFNNWFEIVPT